MEVAESTSYTLHCEHTQVTSGEELLCDLRIFLLGKDKSKYDWLYSSHLLQCRSSSCALVFILQGCCSVGCRVSQTMGVSFSKQPISWRAAAYQGHPCVSAGRKNFTADTTWVSPRAKYCWHQTENTQSAKTHHRDTHSTQGQLIKTSVTQDYSVTLAAASPGSRWSGC